MTKKISSLQIRVGQDLLDQHNQLINSIIARTDNQATPSEAFRAILHTVLKNPELKEAVIKGASDFLLDKKKKLLDKSPSFTLP